MSPRVPDAMQGITFAISQLGVHAAMRFAERVAPLGLVPPQVGLIQLIGEEPGQSQQALARRIGIPPSRLVGVVDQLEQRGLVRRERSPADRRVHALALTAEGEEMRRRLTALVREQETELTAALAPAEREQLRALLHRIADQQGLEPGIHPGLAKLRWKDAAAAHDAARRA